MSPAKARGKALSATGKDYSGRDCHDLTYRSVKDTTSEWTTD